MARTTRFQPIDVSALVRPGGALDPAAAAKMVAAIARATIREAEATNEAALGRAPPKRTFVNGAPSDRFDEVRPGQSIVAVFDLGVDVVRFVQELCVKHAPVLTGAFRASIRTYADGVEVGSPEEAAGAAEVVITSVSPYARKIEGSGGRKPQSALAPDGVFEAVATLARARFGNVAQISFTYVNPIGGATELDAWARKHSALKSRPHKAYARDTRQPSIVIRHR